MIKEAFKKFYNNKKVFVTGHTGFKGAWLSLWLIEMGAKVTGYSLEPPTHPSLFEVLKLSSRMDHRIGDVRNEKLLFDVMNEVKPDIVFHLAAQALVRASYQKPKETYETNVIGTVNLLESIRKIPEVKAVVIITSDKCYENREWIYGYRECDPMGGFDPYSSSKGCAELVVAAYRNSFFNSSKKDCKALLASVRAGNVIGGGDWAEDRLIPDCAKALSMDKAVIIRNPLSIRPWQHVLEPLSGYLWLGRLLYLREKDTDSAWNFGPNDEDIMTVESVVKKVIRAWGRGEYRVQKKDNLHEAGLLKLDISKAHHHLYWKPVLPVEEAIEWTVQWYRRYYDGKPMMDFTIRQIEEYIKRAKENKIKWSL